MNAPLAPQSQRLTLARRVPQEISESLIWSRLRYMECHYANYFNVGFNEQEIVIDFGQHHGGEETLMHTRIVICRAYLSTLVAMLEASDGKIEQNVEARRS
ncbi:MAG: hypothetical protein ABI833_03820 [Acidobacteriota bacterium]